MAANDPLISIIIPVYKVEAYLNRCIDSILNQTYRNLEIILVDDGSPDNCGCICNEYRDKDVRIVVLHKENGGLSDARNYGLNVAKGDYISFVDSDDWVCSKYVETLYSNLLSTNSDISIIDFQNVYNEKNVVESAESDVKIFSNIEALEQIYGRLYVKFIIACGKLYKRHLFKQIRFPKGKLHEDEFTTYKLLYKAKLVCYCTLQGYYYYQREGSIMSNFSKQNFLDLMEAYEERVLFFERENLNSLRIDTLKRFSQLLTNNYKQKDCLFCDSELTGYNKAYKNCFHTLMKFKSLSLKKRLKYTFHFYIPTLAIELFNLKSKIRNYTNAQSNKKTIKGKVSY